MDLTQTAELLATITSFDRRTTGDADYVAWQLALDDIDPGDAHRAVVEHYRASNDWIMPADIRRRVSEIRLERLQHMPSVEELMADVDFDEPTWWLVRRERKNAIAGGMPPAAAIASVTPATVRQGPRSVTG